MTAAPGNTGYHVVGVGRGASGERAERTGLAVVERFDVAPGQQPGQESLAAVAPPRLRYHGRGSCELPGR